VVEAVEAVEEEVVVVEGLDVTKAHQLRSSVSESGKSARQNPGKHQ
jgi:hypothetical protein